jgi:cysteine desulfurase/selenocysteine lyase
MSHAATPPLDTARIRADFPILATRTPSGAPLVYLDSAATTQHPRQVIQAVTEVYEQSYANVHRGIHWLSDRVTDLFEQARDKTQSFIHAPAREEVIFTRGATESINLVARSWGDAFLRPGDEILLTELEHHANIVPWHDVAARTGACVRFCPIADDGRLDREAFDRLLTERTRMVAVTAVSNVLGTINPVAEIVAHARAVGAATLIDVAQSAPHEPLDVQQLGADFVAFSGHKMLGPSGVGVLWGRAELLDAMPPFLGGGNMIRRVTTEGYAPAELPAKFEAGTPPIAPVIGLGAAIDYLNGVGLDAIAAHERALTRRAHERLAQIEGVRILGPAPEHKAGIIGFAVEGVHAHDVAQVLDQHGVAIRAGHHCAMPLHKRLGLAATARASFYLYSTADEVETLAQALVAARGLFAKRSSKASV